MRQQLSGAVPRSQCWKPQAPLGGAPKRRRRHPRGPPHPERPGGEPWLPLRHCRTAPARPHRRAPLASAPRVVPESPRAGPAQPRRGERNSAPHGWGRDSGRSHCPARSHTYPRCPPRDPLPPPPPAYAARAGRGRGAAGKALGAPPSCSAAAPREQPHRNQK